MLMTARPVANYGESQVFRRNTCALPSGGGHGPRKPPTGGRIALAMDAFPPERRPISREVNNGFCWN